MNWLYLMDGPTILTSTPVNIVADLDWKVEKVADFNGDGKADILWRQAATGTNRICFMNGAATATCTMVNTVADLNWQIGP